MKLEKELAAMRHEYTVAVEECAAAHVRVKFLEDLQSKPVKNEDVKKDEDVARLTFENETLKEKLVERDDTIKDLQSSLNIKMEVSKSLNKQLSETKAKAGKGELQ